MSDDTDKRLRHLETQLALVDQKLDALTKALEKKQTTMDWILRAAFIPIIASAVAFVTSGGLNK